MLLLMAAVGVSKLKLTWGDEIVLWEDEMFCGRVSNFALGIFRPINELEKHPLNKSYLRGSSNDPTDDGPSWTHREAYGLKLKPRPLIMIRVAGGASHLRGR